MLHSRFLDLFLLLCCWCTLMTGMLSSRQRTVTGRNPSLYCRGMYLMISVSHKQETGQDMLALLLQCNIEPFTWSGMYDMLMGWTPSKGFASSIWKGCVN